MKKHKLVRITPKTMNLFGSMVVYFNGHRQSALRKAAILVNPAEYVHPISLQGIYDQFKCRSSDKNVVKMAANIFFEQKFRGNNVTKKCSGWTVRPQPRINNQIKKLLPELFKLNEEHIAQVSTAVMGKDKTASVTTTFKFASTEQAALFADLINGLNVSEE